MKGLKGLIRDVYRVLRYKELNIVYTMGKVGSRTIAGTLKENGIFPLFHIHQFNFKRKNDRKFSAYDFKYLLLTKLILLLKKFKKLNLIILTREIVNRNLSSYFFNINSYYSDYELEDIMESEAYDRVMDNFVKNYYHDYPLDWFDSELKDVFGINIYDYAFDDNKDFLLVRNDNVNVLVMKLETLSDVYRPALYELYHEDFGELVRTNDGEDRKYGDMYKKFKANVTVPCDYVNDMHNSKYSKFFYTDAETVAYTKKFRIG